MTIFFTIGLIGTVFILKYGTILDPLKRMVFPNFQKFQELFNCSLCLGFHVGLFWMVIYQEHLHFITPFYSAAVCWVADTLVQFLQGCDLLIMKKVKKD